MHESAALSRELSRQRRIPPLPQTTRGYVTRASLSDEPSRGSMERKAPAGRESAGTSSGSSRTAAPRPVDRFVPLPSVARLDAVPVLHHGSALSAHQPNAARLHGQDRTAEPASNRSQCPVRASCITHRRSVGRDREQYSIFVRLPRPIIPPGGPEGIAQPAHGRRSPPQLRGNAREVVTARCGGESGVIGRFVPRITLHPPGGGGGDLRADLRPIEIEGSHGGALRGAGVPVVVSGQDDVIPAQRRDVPEQARLRQPALPSQVVCGFVHVRSVPVHDRGDDQVQGASTPHRPPANSCSMSSAPSCTSSEG